jgi:hypothetical protein
MRRPLTTDWDNFEPFVRLKQQMGILPNAPQVATKPEDVPGRTSVPVAGIIGAEQTFAVTPLTTDSAVQRPRLGIQIPAAEFYHGMEIDAEETSNLPPTARAAS